MALYEGLIKLISESSLIFNVIGDVISLSLE